MCRELPAVPPRHWSMGPLSVALGGARPWWPYRLLDLLLVIITALMSGHTWGNIVHITSAYVLVCRPRDGAGPWPLHPGYQLQGGRGNLCDILPGLTLLSTVTDNIMLCLQRKGYAKITSLAEYNGTVDKEQWPQGLFSFTICMR